MAIHGTSGDPQDERTLLPEVRYHSRWLAEQRCSTEDVHSQVPLTRPTMETRTSSRASKALLQTSHATRDVDGFRHAGAVKGKIYSRRSMCRNTWPSQWILRSSLIAAMILFFFASTSSSYKCTQFHEDGLAEIVPKDDIVRPVNETFEVLCHHDPELLANDTIVQFLKRLHGNFVDVPSTRINESTISTELTHNVSEDYNLYCVSFQKKTKLRKHLCYRRIFVGYPPLDFLDFRCRAPNRESLDCSWSRPANSVPTKYTYAYRVPNYKTESMQIDEVGHNNFTFNLWPSVGTRSDVIILVTANNKLGSASFSHSVNTYEVVVPPAAKINNKSIGTDFVKVTWNLTYLMDSMSSKLIQEVSYRIPPQQTWTSKRDMAKYTEDSAHKHIYFEKLSLPHAGLLYEVRIRTHTKVGEIREDYWSAPSYVNVTTLPLPPEKSALTNPSSFEVRDALRSRDLYIYWQQVDRLHHNGPDLHYSVMAYNDSTSDPMLTMPVLSNGTYAMFGDLEFNVNYRFEITVVNAVGQVADTSQVIVPTRSQLQLLPVPAMFTVINYYNPTASRSPIQRLMWKAPDVPEAIQNDLRYILYWCPRNPYSARCEENLAWESAGDDLNALRLHDGTRDIPVIYQRNLTGLGEDLQFGIAAVQKSTNMSSGIKWASCSVFHADSPPAPNKPIAVILSSSSVRLSWKFECRDKSAVPLQVNISYCENMADGDIVDFSGCTSPLKFHLGQLTGPALIEGLRPSAKIIFAISLVTIVGESQPSQAITVQMLQDVPGGPPSSLNITAVTSTTISLEWSPPEPHLANGNITSYEISTQPPTTARMHPAGNTEKNSWMLSGLAPYTQYVVSVAACTQVNRVDRCAVQHPAIAYSTTDPGVPDEVNMFSVNSVRGQVSWAFEEEACHSQKCSFDLEILYNDTLIKQYNLTQNSVSLKDLNVTCRQSKTLTVSLRAVGVGLDGSPIYGPWTAVDQSCSLAAVPYLAWWIILGVVLTCAVVSFIVLLLTKYGFNVFHQCTDPIKVPNLTTINDMKQFEKKAPQSALPSNGIALPPGHGQVLINPGYTNTGATKVTSNGRDHHGPGAYDENKKIPLLSQTSQSSEVDGVEDDNDRHPRNLSGNSSRSSGAVSGLSSEADSALASAGDAHDTSSAGSGESGDSDSRYLRQVRDPWAGNNLRQRSPGPYVMHGERPLKNISEGYVAVRSNPSLMGDLSLPRSSRGMMSTSSIASGGPSNNGSLQRSTPNLPTITGNGIGEGGSQPGLAFMGTPGSSAGYFSTTESDPPMGDELSTVLSEMPRSRSGLSSSSGLGGPLPATTTAPPFGAVRSPSFPAYSRYSVTPPAKQKPPSAWGVEETNNRNASSNLGDLRYVAVAFNSNANNGMEGDESRLGSPESFNGSLDVKRRPPSIPSLVNVGECDPKIESGSPYVLDSNSPYSVVGTNKNPIIHPVPSSQGYVTLSNQPRPHTTDTNNINESVPPSTLSNTPISQMNNRTDQSFSPSRVVGDSNGLSNNSPQGLFSRPDQRGPSSSSGYVTLGERGFPSANPSLRSSPPARDPGLGSTTSSPRSHYVTAAPDRWAFNNPRPKQLDMADEVRYVASAPCENLRGRVNPQKGDHHDSKLSPQLNERPNTADGSGSRPKRLSQSPSTGWPSGGPSLSKQSSGYVSQEALASDPNAMISPRLFSEEHTKALRSAGLGSEPLVMSPKRLISTEPTKAMKSVGHEVSFV